MRKFPILWGLLASACLLAGSLLLRPTSATTTAAPRLSSALTVRSLPEYRNAEALYARGDRFVAHRALVGLLSREGLSPEDRAYLKRQVTLTAPTPPRSDCGPRALALVCQSLGIPVEGGALSRAAGTSASGTTLEGLKRAAASVGLTAEGVQVDEDALRNLPLPAIAWLDGNHFVAVLALGSTATIHDPNHAVQSTLPVKDLLVRSGGIFLTLRR